MYRWGSFKLVENVRSRIYKFTNAHQDLLILVVDARVLGCVADSLQDHDRRFASISPTDYKNTKASICRSEIIGITVSHSRLWVGKGKKATNIRQRQISD